MTENDGAQWLFGVDKQELSKGEEYQFAEGVTVVYKDHYKSEGFQEQWAFNLLIKIGEAIVPGIIANAIWDKIQENPSDLQLENDPIDSTRQIQTKLEDFTGIKDYHTPETLIKEWRNTAETRVSETEKVLNFKVAQNDGIERYRRFLEEVASVVYSLRQSYDNAPKAVDEDRRNQLQELIDDLTNLQDNVNLMISWKMRLQDSLENERELEWSPDELEQEIEKTWNDLNRNLTLIEDSMADIELK